MALIDDIKNVGLNSYLVLGRHPAVTGKAGGEWAGRPTESVGDSTHRNIYPFLSEEIGVEIDTVVPQLNTGDSGPKKTILGQIGLAGAVNFGVGEDQIGEILRWITGSDNQPAAADSTRAMSGGNIISASHSSHGRHSAEPSRRQPARSFGGRAHELRSTGYRHCESLPSGADRGYSHGHHRCK